MASDYTIIIQVRQQFGQFNGIFDAVEASVPFVGSERDFQFDCPGVDSGVGAVLMFQSFDVTYNKNVFEVNQATAEQPTIFGGIPIGSPWTWVGNIMHIRSGVLKEVNNVLHIESRDFFGGSVFGAMDDFIIDNVTVMYKTEEPGPRDRTAPAADQLAPN